MKTKDEKISSPPLDSATSSISRSFIGSDPKMKTESEYVKSYKLRIAALERELAEKKKIIEMYKESEKTRAAENLVEIPKPTENEVKFSFANPQKVEEITEIKNISNENNIKDLKIKQLEELISTKIEQIAELEKQIENSTQLELENQRLQERNALLENQMKKYTDRMNEKDIECKEGMKKYLEDLLKLEDENNKLKTYLTEYKDIDNELEKTKEHVNDLLEELQFYKKKCDEQESDILYLHGQIENNRNQCSKEEIEEFKKKINEQNELRIRDLLSQNGFLRIQLSRYIKENAGETSTDINNNNIGHLHKKSLSQDYHSMTQQMKTSDLVFYKIC